MHIVYILHSKKLDRFYTGYSTNLEERLQFHQSALPHKFTAKAKDWKFFMTISCEDKKQALEIEAHIKRMKSRTYIKNLKKYPEIIQKLKDRYNS